MNCGDCGRKMIVISCNYGIIVYCPNCCPDGDKIFMKGKK